MAASELIRNGATRYCRFYIDTSEEVSKLPTQTSFGTDELEHCAPCVIGSCATDGDGNYYVLDGTGTWKKCEGSGGGGSTTIDRISDEEIMALFDQ